MNDDGGSISFETEDTVVFYDNGFGLDVSVPFPNRTRRNGTEVMYPRYVPGILLLIINLVLFCARFRSKRQRRIGVSQVPKPLLLSDVWTIPNAQRC